MSILSLFIVIILILIFFFFLQIAHHVSFACQSWHFASPPESNLASSCCSMNKIPAARGEGVCAWVHVLQTIDLVGESEILKGMF